MSKVTIHLNVENGGLSGREAIASILSEAVNTVASSGIDIGEIRLIRNKHDEVVGRIIWED